MVYSSPMLDVVKTATFEKGFDTLKDVQARAIVIAKELE